MVRNSGQGVPAGRLSQSAAALRAGLSEAEAALAAGDMELAERQAKAIIALARAAKDVSEVEALARDQAPEEDEEALRAEIRSRIARFVDAASAGDPDETLERLARETFSE